MNILRPPGLRAQRGGVTIMTLVLLIVFVIITSASISYISRQAHETANKTQEEQAFGLGDAGVPYAQWLLSDLGGKATPEELAQAFQAGVSGNLSDPRNAELYAAFTGADGEGRPVCDDGVCGPNATVLGTFKLAFGYDGDTGEVEVLSVGKDVNKPGECQRVRAFLIPFDNQGYQVVRWDHEPSRDCDFNSNEFEFSESECSDDADNDGDGVPDDADFSCQSDTDDDETFDKSQCQDGIDNDNDGTADAAGGGGLQADLGCQGNLQKNSEKSSNYVCDNGNDDDNDGQIDYPADTGCSGPTDTTEQPAPACANGIDDDLDGTADATGAGGLLRDVGCNNDPLGASELSGTVCNNGVNDDNQTGTDYRTPGNGGDPDCTSVAGTTEAPLAVCSDGIDNDNDGLIDKNGGGGKPADTGCALASSATERGGPAQCDNGIDDDNDGKTDYLSNGSGDTHCSSAADTTENDAPANDHYAHATNAAASGANPPTHNVNTSGATTEANENLAPCGPSIGKTVWYKYVVGGAANPVITVDTVGSSFNTVLAVYKDNGNGLNNEELVGCNSNGTVSKVMFTPQIASTYFFQVSGTGNQGGNATFRFQYKDCSYGNLALPSSAAGGWLTDDCPSTEQPGYYVDYFRFVTTAPNTKVRTMVWAWTGEFAPSISIQGVAQSNSCIQTNNAACIPTTFPQGSITLPTAGVYQIAVTSQASGATGPYVISLAQDFSGGGGSSPSPSPSP